MDVFYRRNVIGRTSSLSVAASCLCYIVGLLFGSGGASSLQVFVERLYTLVIYTYKQCIYMYEELLIVVKFRFFKDFLEACIDNKLVMNNGFVNWSC